jgi:hypothetical protein
MVSGLEAEPMRRTAVSAAFLTALIWCAAPPAADAQISSCTPLGENLYVRDVMTDLYLWYAEMPGADPAAYDSPESYLEAVRFRPLDTTFSYITSRAESDAFFSSSQFVGFGISTAIAGDEMRIMQVFPGRSHHRDLRPPRRAAHCHRRDRHRIWCNGHRRRCRRDVRGSPRHTPRRAAR